MKRIFTAVLTAALLCSTVFCFTGCGADRDGIMSDYMEIIERETETEQELAEKLADAEEFLTKNISKVEEEDADYMLHLYIETGNLVVEDDAESFQALLTVCEPYLSDMMNDILSLILSEIEDPLSKAAESADGGAAFFREAAERALATEELVEKYREQLYSKDYEYLKPAVVWQYEYYINGMLIGTAEKPLFDGETHEFSEDAEAAYTELAQSNPDTVMAWAVNEFYAYLDSIRYELDYKNDPDGAKVYYDTCNYIVKESGKKLYEKGKTAAE